MKRHARKKWLNEAEIALSCKEPLPVPLLPPGLCLDCVVAPWSCGVRTHPICYLVRLGSGQMRGDWLHCTGGAKVSEVSMMEGRHSSTKEEKEWSNCGQSVGHVCLEIDKWGSETCAETEKNNDG